MCFTDQRLFSACIVMGFVLLTLAPLSAGKVKIIEYPPTYRTFPKSYAKVWNAVVRLIIEDLEYVPDAADPQMGFFSTRWKKFEGKDGGNDLRIRIHLNVKKAPKGTLVTVRCEIEEYVPIEGTDRGRWMKIPSDHSCEADILDRLESKLKG